MADALAAAVLAAFTPATAPIPLAEGFMVATFAFGLATEGLVTEGLVTAVCVLATAGFMGGFFIGCALVSGFFCCLPAATLDVAAASASLGRLGGTSDSFCGGKKKKGRLLESLMWTPQTIYHINELPLNWTSEMRPSLNLPLK